MDEESEEESDEDGLKPLKLFRDNELIEEHSEMTSEDDIQEDFVVLTLNQIQRRQNQIKTQMKMWIKTL